MEDPEAKKDQVQFNCPRCGETVEVADENTGQLVRCPFCANEFFASHASIHEHVVDDTIEEERAKELPAEELNGMRISQLTALRRGAIRARSWCLITAVVCIVCAIQLMIKAVLNISHTHTVGTRPIAFALFAIAAGMVSIFFFHRSSELKREIDKPMLDDPQTPPDFSTLSDGSQRWKNLEDIE